MFREKNDRLDLLKGMISLVFSPTELLTHTPTGTGAYLKFDEDKMKFIWDVVFRKFPIPDQEKLGERSRLSTQLSNFLGKIRHTKKWK